MEKIEFAVFDAGPLLHLNEAGALRLLELITHQCVTPEVADEVKGSLPVNTLMIIPLDSSGKDYSKMLIERDEIDLGEATSIALCNKEHIRLFFTDDLEAWDCATREGLSPHGTLAIILRNLKGGLITKKEALQFIYDIHEKSSLYVTSDLLYFIKKEISSWSRINKKG